MAKRKAKEPPLSGDIGPQTEAQMSGAEVHRLKSDTGRGLRRKYRRHILERMHKPERKTWPSLITERQMLAGLELHSAWCETQRSPDSAFSRIYVDSSPRPGDASVLAVQRLFDYAALMDMVPGDCRRIVEHVCCDNRAIRDGCARNRREALGHLSQLQVALDILANEMGY